MKTLLQSLRLFLALTVLTGVLYPLAVWAIAQAAFHTQAEGSLVTDREGRVRGSALLSQKTTSARYFWPRPSAADFATMPSGASNQSWTSAKLAVAMEERRAAFGIRDMDTPPDLLTASGSGLDPELSPEAIRIQSARVAKARGLTPAQVQDLDSLITAHTIGGDLAPRRINVLLLNLALDEKFSDASRHESR